MRFHNPERWARFTSSEIREIGAWLAPGVLKDEAKDELYNRAAQNRELHRALREKGGTE